MLKGKNKQKAHWKLHRVLSKITGKDGIVCGLKLKLGSGHFAERPLQLVCDLEIGGGDLTPRGTPNPHAAEFFPRRGPMRSAKDAARSWIKVLADEGKDI